MKFNPAALPGPHLTDLPPERYYELRKLHRTIERQQDTPGRLLQDLTRQLLAALLEQLLAIVRGDSDYQDDEVGPVRAALAACGGMRFEANVSEDSFLVMAWLEVADQALEHMEAAWLLTLTACGRIGTTPRYSRSGSTSAERALQGISMGGGYVGAPTGQVVAIVPAGNRAFLVQLRVNPCISEWPSAVRNFHAVS